MVKACKKKIIILKNIESDIIEEAHFILKDKGGNKSVGESDMVKEANRIISESLIEAKNKGNKHTGKELFNNSDRLGKKAKIKWFFYGVITCFCTLLVLSLTINI